MLCLPPETLNRRTAPVTSPQPRPARPSRAAVRATTRNAGGREARYEVTVSDRLGMYL